MKHFIFLSFILFTHSTWAQDTLQNVAPIDSVEFSETQPKPIPDRIYVYCDDREFFINFPGGDKACNKFIKKNIQFKRTDTFTGNKKAVVFFTVDEEGHISDITINEDLDPLIKEQVMLMMHKMPTWKWHIEDKARRTKIRKVIRITVAD